MGYTIKSLSEFSLIRNHKHHIISFEEQCEFALKGIEINVTSGDVFDKDILHGLAQLKYPLPYILKRDVEGNIFGFLEDAKPSYAITILVTNADLYILNDNFSISRLKAVDDITDLAKKVPYLICYSDLGPDFTQHHKEIFEGLNTSIAEHDNNLKTFENFQQKFKHKKYDIYDSPITTCSDLEESSYYILRKYYSQHFVCSFEHFPDLINELLKTLSKVTKIKSKA